MNMQNDMAVKPLWATLAELRKEQDDELAEFKAENERLRTALAAIVTHQTVMVGTLSNMSQSLLIAKQALEHTGGVTEMMRTLGYVDCQP